MQVHPAVPNTPVALDSRGAPEPRGDSARQEIAALAQLATDAQVAERLRQLAQAYGRVASVSVLPETDVGPLFLVHFEQVSDAITAANSLRCPLFGFSTLIVPVPRHVLPPTEPASVIEH